MIKLFSKAKVDSGRIFSVGSCVDAQRLRAGAKVIACAGAGGETFDGAASKLLSYAANA